MKAKAKGGDIRMIYSAADALQLAVKHPQRQVIFFAIGFETTTPPHCPGDPRSRTPGPEELQRDVQTTCSRPRPSEPSSIGASDDEMATAEIEGFVGPAHVSIIIGSDPYARFAAEYKKPVVIAGFEPLDVMQAILMLVRQVNEGRAEVENEFIRAVTPQGNLSAQAVMDEVFELRDAFEWRGLGTMPLSALKIRDTFKAFDAEDRFQLRYQAVPDNKACECGAILRGVKEPRDCKIFGHRLHAREPDRFVHGVVRRRVVPRTTPTDASRTLTSRLR